MSKDISLKSIVDFENDKINFYIPRYQRGYRWKSGSPVKVCGLGIDLH